MGGCKTLPTLNFVTLNVKSMLRHANLGIGYSPTGPCLSSVIMTSDYVIESITLCQDVGYDENPMGSYVSTLFYASVVRSYHLSGFEIVHVQRKEGSRKMSALNRSHLTTS